MTAGPTRERACRLDAEDPLAGFRELFVIDPDIVYLNGNSLGRLPRATARRVAAVVDHEWGEGLVGSWSSWIDQPLSIGDRLGAALLGASPGQVVVTDTTTVNLYKLAHAAIDIAGARETVITDRGNFPTDRYVLQAVARSRQKAFRLVDGPGVEHIDATTAVVSFSLVDYRTGALADIESITAAAHDAGALVLWDLSHAAGAVEVGLDGADVDMAVGCTYKYLNGGPGAPAFAYVAARHHHRIDPVIPGWLGHADRFAMGPDYVPGPGVARLLTGTYDPRALAAVEEGVALLDEAGMASLRTKSLALSDLVMVCVDAWLGDELEIVTPREQHRRGSHVALRHPQAWPICQALMENHRVIADFREPDILRLGLAPIYTSFEEAWIGMQALRTVVGDREHRSFPAERPAVT